jgi:5-methylcytosine-specific restriction endonuclease McrA
MSCFVCGETDSVQVHHIDHHHGNDRPSNRVPLCERCHAMIHRDFGFTTIEELRKLRAEVEARDPARFRRSAQGGLFE